LSSNWGVTIVNARVSADTIHRKVWKTIAPSLVPSGLVAASEETVGPIARS
jgi:hypothetical protein